MDGDGGRWSFYKRLKLFTCPSRRLLPPRPHEPGLHAQSFRPLLFLIEKCPIGECGAVPYKIAYHIKCTTIYCIGKEVKVMRLWLKTVLIDKPCTFFPLLFTIKEVCKWLLDSSKPGQVNHYHCDQDTVMALSTGNYFCMKHF